MYYEYMIKGRYITKDYFISLYSEKTIMFFTSDQDIAKFLGISLEEYQNILIKFNGKLKEQFGDIFFNAKEDCQNAIKYLYEITDSYLVTKELIGG